MNVTLSPTPSPTSQPCFGVRGRAFTVLFLLWAAGCGSQSEHLVASANQYFSHGDYNAAAIQLKNALQQKPRDPEARYLLGICHLRLYDFPSAEKELRRASELGYSPDKAIAPLARALVNQGKLEPLITEFGSTQLSDPKAEAELQTQLGSAYLELKRIKEAQRSFALALEVRPDDPSALVGQAKILAATGNAKGAMQEVDELLVKWPQQPDALTFKASLALAQGQKGEAVRYMKQVVQLQPGNPIVAFSLVSLLFQLGELDEATRQIESIRKSSPNDARTTYLDAMLAFKQGKFVTARQLALQVLKVAPDNLPSLMLAGAASYELDAQQQAQEYLQKVLERSPRALYVRKVLIDSYLRTGDTKAASSLIEQSRKEAPNDADLLVLAAQVAVANGDLDAAARLYKQAEREAPSSSQAAIGLGEVELARGNAREAIQILESASAADNQRTQSDTMLAIYYAARGETDRALGWTNSIEKKQPHNPLPPTLRGSIHLRNKAYPAARVQFERALVLQSDFIPALEGIAQVDVEEKNPEAARKRFEQELNKAPGNEELILSYMRFLRGSGAQLSEVVDFLRRTVKSQPGALRARSALILLYLELGDTAQAKTAAQEGLVVSPESRDLLALTGRAQLAAREPNAAVATYEKLASLEPRAVAPLLMLADAHIANRDRQKAITVVRQALELQPDFQQLQARLIPLYVAEGQTREALALAREMQRQRPRQAIGYRMEADVLLKLHEDDDAERVLETGLKMTSSWILVPPFHKVLSRLGRQAEADAFVKKWIESNPKDVNVRGYVAERAMVGGNYERAAFLFKEILSIEPKSGFALNNLAWVAGQIHDPRALEYAEQANQLTPNTPPVMDTLGWLLVEKGETARGLELLQKAVELAPQQDDIRLHLAKGLLQTNQKDAARKELEYLDSHLDQSQAKAEVEALLRQL